MPLKIKGATSGSTTITAPDTGSDETIVLSTALASKLDDSDATWTTWTPTYTNLTVGNGTVISKYALLNKVCLVRYYIKFGSTTSISGVPKITLPFALNQTADFSIAGFPVTMHDAGSAVHSGVAQVGFTSIANDSVELTHSRVVNSNVETAGLSATAPFTWAVNDKISFSGMYEVA